MSRISFIVSSCLFCVALAALGSGRAVCAQESRASAPAASAHAARPAKRQVVVTAVVYRVKPGRGRALARRYPALVSWLGKGGGRSAEFGSPADLPFEKFAALLRAAERRGLVELRHRSRGVAEEGATFRMAAGASLGLVMPAGGRGRLAVVDDAALYAGQRLSISPRVVSEGGAGGAVVELALGLELSTVETASIPGTPVENRHSVSTAFSARSGRAVVVGGFGRAGGGRLYVAVGGELVGEEAGAGPGGL